MTEHDALYMQLMNNIKGKLQRGEYQIGDKLESERVMARQYGINRLTVRKALKCLTDQGYLKARQGSGTYITRLPQASTRLEQSPGTAASLSMLIRQSGYESSRIVISFQQIPATGSLAEKFPDSRQVFELVRLSKVNGVPYAVQKAYIPAELFWDAGRYDFATVSLYAYMDIHGHSPRRIESFLQIAHPPKEYADLLNLPPDKKVFSFEYLGYDTTERLVEHTFAYYLPQYTAFKYVVEKNSM